MVDFYCIVLVNFRGSQSENQLQSEKYLSPVGFKLTPRRMEDRYLSTDYIGYVIFV